MCDEGEVAFQRERFQGAEDFAAHRMRSIARSPEHVARALARDLVARFDTRTLERAWRSLTTHVAGLEAREERLLLQRVPALAEARARLSGALSFAHSEGTSGALSMSAALRGALGEPLASM